MLKATPLNKETKKIKALTLKMIYYGLENKLPKGTFLNVNIPNCKLDDIKGFKITEQGNQYFNDTFKKRTYLR